MSYLVMDPHCTPMKPVHPPALTLKREQQSYWAAFNILCDLIMHMLLVFNVFVGKKHWGSS